MVRWWNLQGLLQSPVGLLTGMAQGTTSLLSNTVYAISDAATQFSRAAHKVPLHLIICKNFEDTYGYNFST